MSDHWSEANGGFRSSLFLRSGAIAYFLAALIHFTARLIVPVDHGPEDPLLLASLLSWDLALFLLAAGFFWIGIHPFLTRYGIAVGLFITAQAVFLLASLATGKPPSIAPSVLTVGRTMLIAVFAIVEARSIGRKTALVLGITSGLQFLRVLLRNLELWPTMGLPWDAILTASFMVITAGAVFALGNAIHAHEETWALANLPQRHASFDDFNNPQYTGHSAGEDRKPPNA